MTKASISTQEQLALISKPTLVANKITVPNTQISGRAQIIDPANDLSINFGFKRISCQTLYIVNGEKGPSGEIVWGVYGDTYDQIRYVGSWSNDVTTNGSRNLSGASGDFIEITFYGTGLHLLGPVIATSDLRVTIDGGVEGANIVNSSNSTVITNRGYNNNQIQVLASGLDLGTHTIKLRVANANGCTANGFEIIGSSSSVAVNPGQIMKSGKKNKLSSQSTFTYNTSFDSGTLGTRGGRVLVYLKSDGTVGKSVTPTNASQANMSSADHTNEDVIGTHYWRKFGYSRSDDFSILNITTNSSRSGWLEDNQTGLSGNLVNFQGDALDIGGAGGGFVCVTFIGTGLDVILNTTSFTATNTIQIDDDASIGSISAGTYKGITKIVSGLPYGTHTVKITKTSSGSGGIFDGFIVYGPKKPTLPEGAIELGEYFINANYSAISSNGLHKVSQGVNRKFNTREILYAGTWPTYSSDPTQSPGGHTISSNTTSSTAELTFWGTGFEFRGMRDTNLATSITMTINGTAFNSTNFPSVTTNALGWSYTHSTGVLNQNGALIYGCALQVSGLPLAKYTVRFTFNTGSNMDFGAMDILCPIHFPKLNDFYNVHNTLEQASSIGDSRAIYPTPKRIAKSVGVTVDPTQAVVAFNTVIPEMYVTINSIGAWYSVNYTLGMNAASSVLTRIRIYINGVFLGREIATASITTSNSRSLDEKFYLPPGQHTIFLTWKAGDTLTAIDIGRVLTVTEI